MKIKKKLYIAKETTKWNRCNVLFGIKQVKEKITRQWCNWNWNETTSSKKGKQITLHLHQTRMRALTPCRIYVFQCCPKENRETNVQNKSNIIAFYRRLLLLFLFSGVQQVHTGTLHNFGIITIQRRGEKKRNKHHYKRRSRFSRRRRRRRNEECFVRMFSRNLQLQIHCLSIPSGTFSRPNSSSSRRRLNEMHDIILNSIWKKIMWFISFDFIDSIIKCVPFANCVFGEMAFISQLRLEIPFKEEASIAFFFFWFYSSPSFSFSLYLTIGLFGLVVLFFSSQKCLLPIRFTWTSLLNETRGPFRFSCVCGRSKGFWCVFNTAESITIGILFAKCVFCVFGSSIQFLNCTVLGSGQWWFLFVCFAFMCVCVWKRKSKLNRLRIE